MSDRATAAHRRSGHPGRGAPAARRALWWACLTLAAAAVQAARADSILLVGSADALGPCQIESLAGGQVIFVDARGQRLRRPLEEVRALSFDGLVRLDQAEAALAGGDLDVALSAMLQAFLDAPTDLQRRWVHARLSRLHDRRGEYVEAARHAAGVWLLDQDPYWRILEPLSRPDTARRARPEALAEALAVMGQADRQVRSQGLVRVIDAILQRLLVMAGPSAAALAAGDPGRTLSGFTHQEIRAGVFGPAAPASSGSSRGGAQNGSSAGLDAIDTLLRQGGYQEALTAARGMAEDVPVRDLPRLLHQMGAALGGSGAHQDAAVMYLRAAILYPDSPFGAAGLIEAAFIYRDHYRMPRTARRLLGEAAARAEARGWLDMRQRAAAELERLGTAQ
jgi:tetratricopeptide (TPR) repeat protein